MKSDANHYNVQCLGKETTIEEWQWVTPFIREECDCKYNSVEFVIFVTNTHIVSVVSVVSVSMWEWMRAYEWHNDSPSLKLDIN